jgi:protein-disulfide isomerase
MFFAVNPDDPIETGTTDDGRPYMGQADAPVTIYEFADFQCPHCRDYSRGAGEEVKRDLLETGRARLVWVNFPILGDESVQAAKAATCAHEQGQFWAFHDWLFANQSIRRNSGAFSEARLNEMAALVDGIDADAFATCMDSSEIADRVQDDLGLGNENSVTQTPSFLVGDTVVGGTLNEITQAVTAAGG